MLWRSILAPVLFVPLISATQLPFVDTPFGSPAKRPSQNTGTVPARTADLRSLSTSRFTSFKHPSYPSHGLRIKQTSDFCDPTVKSYTGYLDVDYGAKHLFFYFFESRSNPDKDDVLMWINGGPGCSSSMGLFMELGPCSVVDPTLEDGNGTRWNPHSWNTNTNIFFLDQPVGSGFSYADFGETIVTTEDAAKNVAAFVALFFETFHQFKGRPFHMSGESYGGRSLPLFASEIVDQNAVAESQGRTPINLKSVLIGNGLTDVITMTPSYYDIQCTPASVAPFADITSCVAMKTALPRCEKWLNKECVDRFDAIGCSAALDFCRSIVYPSFRSTGKSPYDVSKTCVEPIEETLCYPETKRINQYLDQPKIRRILGVEESLGNFTSCNDSVMNAFTARLDVAHPTNLYVAQLLERNIRVLIYAGTYDWICNHVGNYRWASALDWTGHDEFNANELREWTTDGSSPAGKTKTARNGLFTFATIFGAGHMVPFDKPVESLVMLQRWLAREDL